MRTVYPRLVPILEPELLLTSRRTHIGISMDVGHGTTGQATGMFRIDTMTVFNTPGGEIYNVHFFEREGLSRPAGSVQERVFISRAFILHE